LSDLFTTIITQNAKNISKKLPIHRIVITPPMLLIGENEILVMIIKATTGIADNDSQIDF
jgi:hypothetical protein